MKVSISINGTLYERDVEPRTLLVHFIREANLPGLDRARRVPDIDRPRLEALERAAPRTQHRTIADRNPRSDERLRGDPGPIADDDGPGLKLESHILYVVGPGTDVRALRCQRVRRERDLGH